MAHRALERSVRPRSLLGHFHDDKAVAVWISRDWERCRVGPLSAVAGIILLLWTVVGVAPDVCSGTLLIVVLVSGRLSCGWWSSTLGSGVLGLAAIGWGVITSLWRLWLAIPLPLSVSPRSGSRGGGFFLLVGLCLFPGGGCGPGPICGGAVGWRGRAGGAVGRFQHLVGPLVARDAVRLLPRLPG